jgi:hypothetical protein
MSWSDYLSSNAILELLPNGLVLSKKYRVQQKQLDDLNLAPLPCFTRWRAITHGDVWSGSYIAFSQHGALVEKTVCICHRNIFLKTMIQPH